LTRETIISFYKTNKRTNIDDIEELLVVIILQIDRFVQPAHLFAFYSPIYHYSRKRLLASIKKYLVKAEKTGRAFINHYTQKIVHDLHHISK
jgi:hypothetical protein